MKPKPCHDGFCGAEDCPRCRPGNFYPGGCYYPATEGTDPDAHPGAEAPPGVHFTQDDWREDR